MTNFHYCKLLVVRNYTVGIGAATQVPAYNDVHNLITDTLEFSAGGQVQTIDMPFCSPYDQIECTKDFTTAAFNHGMVYIYLVQPLTFNSNVPTSVNFNVYMSAGDDFQYFGYATDSMGISPGSAPIYTSAPLLEETERKWEAHSGEETTVASSSQEDIINQDCIHPPLAYAKHFRPMTNVRDYIRRLYQCNPVIMTDTTDVTTTQTVVFNVAQLVTGFGNGPFNPFQVIRSMYLGISGGVKVKFRILNASNASLKFVPPGTGSAGIGSFNTIYPTRPYPQTLPLSGQFDTRENFDNSAMPSFCPSIEKADIVSPYAGITVAPTVSNTLNNIFELECVIPNMNMFDFVGDGAGIRADPSLLTNLDMGNIVIAYVPAFDGTTYRGVHIQPYIGASDETRLGFQVACPPRSIPSITISGQIYRVTIFNQNTLVSPGAPSLNPITIPAMYYFNVT
jgi:hypothetical protein